MKDRIRTLRKINKLSQNALAKMLNVHQTAVSQWENGRTVPDVETLPRLAGLFQVSTDYLLGLDNEQNQTQKTSPAKMRHLG